MIKKTWTIQLIVQAYRPAFSRHKNTIPSKFFRCWSSQVPGLIYHVLSIHGFFQGKSQGMYQKKLGRGGAVSWLRFGVDFKRGKFHDWNSSPFFVFKSFCSFNFCRLAFWDPKNVFFGDRFLEPKTISLLDHRPSNLMTCQRTRVAFCWLVVLLGFQRLGFQKTPTALAISW